MKMTRMNESILVRCKAALRNSFLRNNGTTLDGSYKDYASSVKDNLFTVPTLDLCQGDFKSAKGHELVGRQGQPPKMAAVFSSSALAVNSFAPWRENPCSLRLADDTGFSWLRFVDEKGDRLLFPIIGSSQSCQKTSLSPFSVSVLGI